MYAYSQPMQGQQPGGQPFKVDPMRPIEQPPMQNQFRQPRNGGLAGLMQQYLSAGNPVIGSQAFNSGRDSGQHPFIDWLRSNHQFLNPQSGRTDGLQQAPWPQAQPQNTGLGGLSAMALRHRPIWRQQ